MEVEYKVAVVDKDGKARIEEIGRSRYSMCVYLHVCTLYILYITYAIYIYIYIEVWLVQSCITNSNNDNNIYVVNKLTTRTKLNKKYCLNPVFKSSVEPVHVG